jgi:hypothetical protein
MVVKNKALKFENDNSLKKKETPQTIIRLIKRLERPKVRKCKGKVINFKIGFIKKLINPKNIPIITINCQTSFILILKNAESLKSFKWTPGIKLYAK